MGCKLTSLDLSGNKLEGELPQFLSNCRSLEFLDIGNNKLEGSLHQFLSFPNSIGNLNSLWHLNLSHNCLTGYVPASLGNMTRLDSLDLSSNQLEGEIPTSITNASQLTAVDLSSNSFTGSIPNFGNLSRLRLLYLSENNLTGAESPNQELGFLSSLTNCPNLTDLDISNNLMMNGILPDSIGNLSSLVSFTASNCSIRGFIPPTYQKDCMLQSLDLNGNKLEGALPQSLSNCRSLEVLDIGNNRIQDTFPVWTEHLTDLRVLILRSNKFSGTVSSPTSETRLPFLNLQVFDISRNAFIGKLPYRYLRNFKAMMDVHENHPGDQERVSLYRYSFTLTVKGLDLEYNRILTALTTIDMSSNRFSGSIPNSIGNLNSLIYLNLSHNFLTGGIPASLGNVTELESLDLSSNRLEGQIPTELTKLSFLSVMNLSMNNLSGKIPQSSGQFPTFENSSYVGNSGLCGFPLTRKCEEALPSAMLKEGDHDNGILEGFCWQAVVSGYGCGFVVGGIVGCLILGYGRPKWLLERIYIFYRIKMRSRRGNVAPQRRRKR